MKECVESNLGEMKGQKLTILKHVQGWGSATLTPLKHTRTKLR